MASVPHGSVYVVFPHAQETVTDSGQGRHGPEWQAAGHRWLLQRSRLPHACGQHNRLGTVLLSASQRVESKPKAVLNAHLCHPVMYMQKQIFLTSATPRFMEGLRRT